MLRDYALSLTLLAFILIAYTAFVLTAKRPEVKSAATTKPATAAFESPQAQ